MLGCRDRDSPGSGSSGSGRTCACAPPRDLESRGYGALVPPPIHPDSVVDPSESGPRASDPDRRWVPSEPFELRSPSRASAAPCCGRGPHYDDLQGASQGSGVNIPGARRAVVCAPPLAYSGARVGEQLLAESCWNCDLGGVSCERWRWVHRGPWCLFRDRQVSVLDLISRRTIQHHRHRAGCAERTDERSSGTLRVLPSPESRRASPAFGYDATRIAGSSGRRDTLEARMSCPGTSVLYPRVVCVLYARSWWNR